MGCGPCVKEIPKQTPPKMERAPPANETIEISVLVII